HIQHSIIADSIAFVNAGKAFDNGQNADAADTPATKARKAAKAEGEAPVPPADAPQDKSEDLPF
ncbi:single-stranded DNA-binding protein, partial [Bacteroides sp. MSK.18.22]|nr:single-stranded DNA-binding protein [Bacteroides sp. MSK.18.91]MBV3671301.1 single-stranded DNA-binding protein [Bacteroides sp. MSK.18.83]MBV3715691.1 single-stranded DNA-binding protein [Bacteroides sp. MSK.18.39]MBV3742258.1 single-stranded DNA-binding protein [Bacteroides sp. MSK.18.37]MBV3757878.1 single-stranded DNA-binding protein [Bacteroides sp. MSK.18.22]